MVGAVMTHEPQDCNGGHGCAGRDCACPCHYEDDGQFPQAPSFEAETRRYAQEQHETRVQAWRRRTGTGRRWARS
jgi:hypothetical protein